MAEAKDSSTKEATAGDQALSDVGGQDLSQLPVWNCKVNGTPADQMWTVGEVFQLTCEGPRVEFLSTELSFKHKPEQEFALKILEVEQQTENSLSLKATGYQTGQHSFTDSFIMDQKVEVLKMEPLQLQVKSVITEPEPKPYGPMLGMKLSYPTIFWVIVLSVLATSLFFVLFRWRRRSQMRKVIEELKQHNTALGPFNQFNKDIRRLGRSYIFGKQDDWTEGKKQRYIDSLDEIFRMYLLREFYVPALDWNSGLVLKTIAKQDKKHFDAYGGDLRQFLKELDRARADSEKIQIHDCKQLTQMAKRVSQQVWKVRRH